MKREIENYKRGLTDEQFDQVVKDCCDKMEGLNDLDWQDIVEKYDLEINHHTLRKAFTAPMGGYAVCKRSQEKNINTHKNTSLFDDIIEEIGELDCKKQEVRNSTNKLNKIKRDFIKSIQISNDIKECLREDFQELLPDYSNYDRLYSVSNDKLVVCISDWHIGYMINNFKGNSYNYDIAYLRLSKLIDEVEKMAKTYDITDIMIVNCGDTIENAYMRENQSYECEFNLSQQIASSIKLLYWFITTISKFANVEFITVGGNHSRATTLKNANIEGDNSNIIIKEQLEMLFETSNNDRISVLDVNYIDDSATFKWCGKKYKVLHGDNRVADKKKLYDSECSIDNCQYEGIIIGHYHNFNVASQNNGAKVITCGCLFGYNAYSVKRMGCSTNASQEILLINENGIDLIKDVDLQIN